MRTVCAWCHEVLREGPQGDGAALSHGICASCRRAFFDEEQEVPLQTFLERLPVPVLAVDAAGRVLTGNARAGAATGVTPAAMQGQLGGDLFECKYARLPDGCGRTEHCAGCAIRRTVEHTHRSGEPQEAISAVQEIATADGSRRVRFRIATRKRGPLVLLRIDEVEPLE